MINGRQEYGNTVTLGGVWRIFDYFKIKWDYKIILKNLTNLTGRTSVLAEKLPRIFEMLPAAQRLIVELVALAAAQRIGAVQEIV